ncbi:MAG: glycosyltransferase family 10 domain-containing protein, partial [Actinomycetota bacterium]
SYRIRRRWSLPDLYQERLRAIRHFAGRDGFDLFGTGWDRLRAPGSVREQVESSYKGPVADKISAMRGYRFALCYENTSFPGYITEKIFDAIFAGAIPVYLGAPDVGDYVPAEVYVDVRNLRDHEGLEQRLRSMPADEAETKRRAARDFLRSPAFDRFRAEHFVAELSSAVRATLET